MQHPSPWPAVCLDALVCLCLTMLIALRSIPPEAGIAMLGSFVGARAMTRLGPPSGGAGGGSSSASSSSGNKPGPLARVLLHAPGSATIGLLAVVLGLVHFAHRSEHA